MSGPRRPRVVAHVAIGLDASTRGFTPDLAAFYGLVGTRQEDVTLTGADTILAQEDALRAAPDLPGPSPDGPLLAVTDSAGRVTAWEELRRAGYWSDVRRLSGPREGEQVDLAGALADLAADGARTVRVDSGGRLIGALLAAGLLDEVSLLVHPCLGGGPPWTRGSRPDSATFALTHQELLDGGLVWVRYDVR